MYILGWDALEYMQESKIADYFELYSYISPIETNFTRFKLMKKTTSITHKISLSHKKYLQFHPLNIIHTLSYSIHCVRFFSSKYLLI